MPEDRRQKVTPLGGGRFRITTTIIEDVDESRLLELGHEVPTSDVPWVEPKPVHAADRVAALQYWAEHLGGYEPRLSGRINVFLREFGLASVRQAIDQVAARHIKGGAAVKYAELVGVLRQLRGRGTGK
jgi:hypothetical protein